MAKHKSLALLIAVTFMPFIFLSLVRGEAATTEATDSRSDLAAGYCDRNNAQQVDKVWNETQQTLTDFTVAGVNLALYGMREECRAEKETDKENAEPPFELFEDFYIGDLIKGDESFAHMNALYKRTKETPSLPFYYDKVAVKRWLPSVGFDIPRVFALMYASELDSTGTLEDDVRAILSYLPNATDYVAKPSNKSRGRGAWSVSHDAESGAKRVTNNVENELPCEKPDFDAVQVARTIAEYLRLEDQPHQSINMRKVKPGFVVEERITSNYSIDPRDDSALEFKVITIFGRVLVAKWRLGSFRGPWWPGSIHRNGTMVKGSELNSLPEWVDWTRVVDIAERLGAHKDMFRADIFVGAPTGSSHGADRYVVSEIQPTSSEPFGDDLMEEIARLWIAGYKMGDYKLVPNTEVPDEYLQAGMLSTDPSKWYGKESK